MTDKKFTEEEIIKCLECCKSCCCKQCDEEPDFQEAINLINRQKSEIDRLKECPKCVYEYDGEVLEYCVQGPCPNFKTVEQIKAEAYKEFADRLKATSVLRSGCVPWYDIHEAIDDLLKEMVGEEE